MMNFVSLYNYVCLFIYSKRSISMSAPVADRTGAIARPISTSWSITMRRFVMMSITASSISTSVWVTISTWSTISWFSTTTSLSSLYYVNKKIRILLVYFRNEIPFSVSTIRWSIRTASSGRRRMWRRPVILVFDALLGIQQSIQKELTSLVVRYLWLSYERDRCG